MTIAVRNCHPNTVDLVLAFSDFSVCLGSNKLSEKILCARVYLGPALVKDSLNGGSCSGEVSQTDQESQVP